MASIAIKSLKPQVGTLRVKHPITESDMFDLPDGTQGPLELYFVGKNSKQWYDFLKKLKDSADLTGVDLFNKISNESHEFVASLLVGWLDNGAIDTKYSPEEAVTLISNPENMWILDQIYKFLLDESHFFLMESSK